MNSSLSGNIVTVGECTTYLFDYSGSSRLSLLSVMVVESTRMQWPTNFCGPDLISPSRNNCPPPTITTMRPLSRLRPSIEAVLSANLQSLQLSYVCRSCRTAVPRRHASMVSLLARKNTEDQKSVTGTAVGNKAADNEDDFVPASNWDGLEWIGTSNWEKKRNAVQGHKFEMYILQRPRTLHFLALLIGVKIRRQQKSYRSSRNQILRQGGAGSCRQSQKPRTRQVSGTYLATTDN